MENESMLRAGPNALVYREPGLYTVSLFDTPVLEDAQLLVSTMRNFLKLGQPTWVVVDLRELRQLDSGPFMHVSQPMLAERESLFELCEGVAVLHDGGMAAASVSGGISMVLGNAFPVKVFTDPDNAFRWSKLSAQKHLDFIQRVEAFRKAPNFVSRCRSYLESNLTDASISALAAALEISQSDLKRQLTAANTSFRAELRSARIDTSKSLLIESAMKMSDIAASVGYRKQQNFTEAFRKSTGMTPSSWRTQHRKLESKDS